MTNRLLLVRSLVFLFGLTSLLSCQNIHIDIKNLEKLKSESIVPHNKIPDAGLIVLKYLPSDFILNDTLIIAPVVYAIDPSNQDTLRIICINVENNESPTSGIINVVGEKNESYYKKSIFLKNDLFNAKRMKTLFCDVVFQKE